MTVKRTIFINLLCLSLQASQTINWDPMSYLKQNCEWRLEGCVEVKKDEIDFRSYPKKMLDNVFACKNSIDGCNEEQIETIQAVTGKKETLTLSDIEGVSITGNDLIDLISKKDATMNSAKGRFIPLGLTKSELLTFAAATSIGLVVFHNDQEIMDYIQETKSEKTQRIADISNLFGREMIAPVAAGSYFFGAIFNNGVLKDVGLITVTAGLATQLVTEGFKKTFKRVRPNGEVGPYQFGEQGNNSFFSGHTSGAFSLATVISETFKEDHKWVPYVAYGAAAMTAYARMHDKKHWGSDVLAGALAGHLVTKIVMRMHDKDESNGGVIISPSYDFEKREFWMRVSFVGKKPKEPFKCEKMPEGREKIRACIEEAYERSK